MKFLPLLLALLVASCGLNGSAGLTDSPVTTTTASSSATATTGTENSTTSITTTSSSVTIPSVPERHPVYKYEGRDGAYITVVCDQTTDAKSLSYSLEGSNLGSGTFEMYPQYAGYREGAQTIGSDGIIGKTAPPAVQGQSVDTIVVVEIKAEHQNGTYKLRGCEPYNY